MPSREWTDTDLNELAREFEIVKSNVKQGTADIATLKDEIRGINHTLQKMASDEIADLRRRAEAPRRFVNAVLLACAATVIPALLIYALTHLHIH